ncbi:MAG: hypothetical protein IK003_03640 [Prevotella sp.]|nr:hypothetical protein [Prevotella sp.]
METKVTTTSQAQQRVPGFACPRCGQFMPVPIQQLLHHSSLVCPWCHQRLNIDRQASAKALSILAKVEEAQQRVNNAGSI